MQQIYLLKKIYFLPQRLWVRGEKFKFFLNIGKKHQKFKALDMQMVENVQKVLTKWTKYVIMCPYDYLGCKRILFIV